MEPKLKIIFIFALLNFIFKNIKHNLKITDQNSAIIVF